MSDETHPDSPSGQPYSAPRQAWGGNADPRNLSYEPEGLRYFGPGQGEGEAMGEGRSYHEVYESGDRIPADEIAEWRVDAAEYIPRLFQSDPVQFAPLARFLRAALLIVEQLQSADSEQARLAEWVVEHCPGEPSQSQGVVDTVIRLITSARAERDELGRDWHRRLNEVAAERDQARADGIEEGRGDMEHLERRWRAEERRACAEMLERRGVVTTDPGERAECCGLPRDEDGFCVHRPGHPVYIGAWSGSGRTPADEG